MVTFYLFFGILYGLALWFLGNFWTKKDIKMIECQRKYQVSILLPFRNELKNLPFLLDKIRQLKYRPFQFILIDDGSDDGSKEYLENWIESYQDDDIAFCLIQNIGEGKKQAIETGISQANGDVILTTDADCELPAKWIEYFLEGFQDSEIQLLAGPVMTKPQAGFLYKFQQIEWASIILVTYLGFELKAPFMCSAANMGYRKQAFLTVNGYKGNSQFLSGDDEFLLKKITKEYGAKSTAYLPINKVWTLAEDSWVKYLSQRARWASKWKIHSSIKHLTFSMLPFFIQIIFLSSFLLLLGDRVSVLVFFILWSIKALKEKRGLGKVLHNFGIQPTSLDYLKVSLLHPWYIICVGIMANFGKIRWKGRNLV